MDFEPASELAQLTPQQIEERVKEREATAALLPPGKIRQAIFVEITQLRAASAFRRTQAVDQLLTSAPDRSA